MKIDWVKTIQAIGWDLDGTLYPPDAIPRQVIRERQIDAVARQNNWSSDEAGHQFGAMVEKLGSTTKALSSLGVDGMGFFRELWDALPLGQYIQPDPKLRLLFDELADFRHFMISNSNTPSQMERKLQLLGLEASFFEVMISTEELGVVKPDPLPFMTGLQKMRLSADQVLYVGDRVETDVVGARRAGMRTCLVGGSNIEADLCIDTVYELGVRLKNAKQKL